MDIRRRLTGRPDVIVVMHHAKTGDEVITETGSRVRHWPDVVAMQGRHQHLGRRHAAPASRGKYEDELFGCRQRLVILASSTAKSGFRSTQNTSRVICVTQV